MNSFCFHQLHKIAHKTKQKKTPHAHSLLSTYKCWLLKDYKKANPITTHKHAVNYRPDEQTLHYGQQRQILLPRLQSRSPAPPLLLFLFLSFQANMAVT